MEAVMLDYKVFTFDPFINQQGQRVVPTPVGVEKIVSIETSRNGMQEILVSENGETTTVELQGLRSTRVKRADVGTGSTQILATQTGQGTGDADVQS